MSEKMSNIDIGDLPNISQSLLECTSPNGARTQEAQCSTNIRTQGQRIAQQREKRNRARNVDKKGLCLHTNRAHHIELRCYTILGLVHAKDRKNICK